MSVRILYVSGSGDYTATAFKREYSGKLASDIMDLISNGSLNPTGEYELDGEEYELDLKVYAVEHVDTGFLKFVRSRVQDEEDSKHRNFYLEDELL